MTEATHTNENSPRATAPLSSRSRPATRSAGATRNAPPAAASAPQPSAAEPSVSSRPPAATRSRTLATSLSPRRPSDNKLGSPRKSTVTEFQPDFSSCTLEKAQTAKQAAERAIRDKKVFVIQGGYKPVRKGLRRRNFVEKFPDWKSEPKVAKMSKTTGDDDADDDVDFDGSGDELTYSSDSEDDTDSVKAIKSRVVRNTSPSFVWTTKVRSEEIRNSKPGVLYNHFPRTACFTTKNGLTQSIRDLPWFGGQSADEVYPRCYRIGSEAERNAFIEDFKLTAAIGILKVVCQRAGLELPKGSSKPSTPSVASRSPDQSKPASREKTVLESISREASAATGESRPEPSSDAQKPPTQPVRQATFPPSSARESSRGGNTVPSSVLSHAMQACEMYLKEQDLSFLDDSQSHSQGFYLGFDATAWDEFLKHYYKVVNYKFQINGQLNWAAAECQSILTRIQPFIPMFACEGERNMWICKPGAMSRGRGITCHRVLHHILSLVPSLVGVREGQMVVQRYIERPLLIHNTKFDIRQWFLVTDWNPLTVWFYKDSYVRLCSQLYSLDKLDNAIHLSNNSVQAYMENDARRAAELPEDNMMTSQQFSDYLRDEWGLGDLFERVVYGKMKDIICNTMQCCQDTVENRKNSFELFGADFMIGEDLSVWLIEINCSPAMGASTYITKQFCSSVMEDTLKVVIDRRYNRDADTGQFELAIRQTPVTIPPYTGQNLLLEGIQVKKPYVPQARPLYVPQVPSRFNMTHRESTMTTATTSSTRQSNDKPSYVSGGGGGGAPSNHVRPFRSDGQSEERSNRVIPEIDSNHRLLQMPAYMLPEKRREEREVNVKQIPVIPSNSNLIKPTAASRSRAMSKGSIETQSNPGETWGKLKLTPAATTNGHPPSTPPQFVQPMTHQTQPEDRPKPLFQTKLASSVDLSKYPHRLNTIPATDGVTSFKKASSNQNVLVPNKSAIIMAPYHQTGSLVARSVLDLPGTGSRSRPLYLHEMRQSHSSYSSLEQDIIMRLTEPPKYNSKKALPVKVAYPKFPSNHSSHHVNLGLQEKPIYFLAPVRHVMPFDRY